MKYQTNRPVVLQTLVVAALSALLGCSGPGSAPRPTSDTESPAAARDGAGEAESGSGSAPVADGAESALEHVAKGQEFEAKGDMQGALREFATAAKLDPGNVEALLGKGKVHESIGENDRAIAAFTAAIEAQPDRVEAYYRRGLVHLLKCDYDAVKKDLKKVVELDSNSEFAQDAIDNLELLESQK